MKQKMIMHLLCIILFSHFQALVFGTLEKKLKKILEGLFVDEDADSIDIDEDHLRVVPECGYMPEKPASSRISNAEESDQHYPWMILVIRRNEHVLLGDRLYCGGTIITKTTAITAAHCICGSNADPNIPPNLLQYTDCIEGRPNTINPPNQIRSWNMLHYNEITAGYGNKDRNMLNYIDIIVAYVMGYPKNNPAEPSTQHGIMKDIGLVITQDISGNGGQFYYYTKEDIDRYKLPIEVGSLCLAAAKHQAPYIYEGKIVTVGWGVRYSDVKAPNGKPDTQMHSCTTNEFGPSSATFRHCNVDDVTSDPNNWGCHRQDKPTGYDAVKCAKYLDEAEIAMRRKMNKVDASLALTIQEIWELTYKIEISDLPPACISNCGRFFCYKPKLFNDHGWCKTDVDNGYTDEHEWGFCGSSCDLMSVSNTIPEIYHKMVWEYKPTLPFRCPPLAHDPKFLKPWVLCIRSLNPQTSVFQFKKGKRGNLKFSNAYKEDSKQLGYQTPCKGDSGSGHWIQDSKGNRKRALVGVNSYGGPFCGDSEHLISTVHPEVLDWIKWLGKICYNCESLPTEPTNFITFDDSFDYSKEPYKSS